MRKKLKRKFIFLMVIILIVALFLSISCEVVSIMLGTDTDSIERRKKEAQQELIKDAELRRKEEEKERIAEEAELLEGFEEEEKLFPDEPITYSGEFDGVGITLIVDYKTTVVSGSVNLSGDDYVDATINGEIDIDTFKVTSNFSGIMGSKEYGKEYPFNGIVTGIISEDLSTFNGEILNDEGAGGEFTATK